MEIRLKEGAEGNRRTIVGHGQNYVIFKGIWTELPDHYAKEINPEIYDIRYILNNICNSGFKSSGLEFRAMLY